MKEIEVFKKGNVWGFSFEVYEDEATTEDNRKTSISTRISKSGYATRNGALKAGQKRYYDYYNKVTYNDLTAEQQQDIAKGLYSLQDLNDYINYMISQ